MSEPPARHNIFKNYTFILYTPIDSTPPSLKFKHIYESADVLVMYTRWGQKVFARTFPNIKTTVIPHGTDINTFYPLPEDEKIKMRDRMGTGKNIFLVGNFNRNQPRKNIPEHLLAFRLFIDAWKSCPKCGMVYFETKIKEIRNKFSPDREIDIERVDLSKIKKCSRCGSSNLYEGESKKGKAYLFLHMVFNSPPEQGWNITEKPWGGDPGGLVEMYDLEGCVLHTEGITVGRGVTDDELNKLYNAMDLTVNASAAEGFGLTSLESMSAGTTPLVTNYGGHVDFVERDIQKIDIFLYRPQPITNALWAIPDVFDFVKKLDLFYYDDPEILHRKYGMPRSIICGKKLRELCSKEDREKVVKYYNWDNIAKMWLQLFESVKLKHRLRPGDRIRLTKV
ncbi:glycosyltransferase family 4 protein [Candidatus Aerophobetes bacterium]|nr:glycosyltransferase family 4 protein [Candidatus Aerophobetes bacterium]